MAHFLAQAFHETGGLTIERESGLYSARRLLEIFGVGRHSAAITPGEARIIARNGPAIFERVYGLGNPRKAKELGNTQPGDGYKYRGGGILQTTGRANYRRMGKKCGVDFETYPEFVLSAEHALKPALAEWSEGHLNVAADNDDIRTITRRINGGYNGLADRQAWLRRIKPLIDRVDLSLIPSPAATPKPKQKPIAETVIIVSAGAAAYTAGVPWYVIAAVAVAIAVAAFAFFKLIKRK
jgi:putative chitinase